MGLLDLFKKSKTTEEQSDLPEILKLQSSFNPYVNKYNTETINNAVYNLLGDFAYFERWIKDTTDPKKYFDNYTKALQVLFALNTYQGRYRFAAPTPIQRINILQRNYSENTIKFIDRYWLSTKRSIQKLKTEKSKQKKIETFKTTLSDDFSEYLTPRIIEHINSIDYNDLSIIIETVEEPKELYCGKYSINTIQEIQSIPSSDLTVMRPLQKAATDHKRNKNYDLAIECLKKSNQISDFSKSRDNKLSDNEYLRLLDFLEKYKPEEYEEKESFIKRIHPEFFDKRILSKANIMEVIKHAKEIGEDTLLITTSRSCSICGRYDNRVFSISGKHKKYPKLPIEFTRDGGVCPEHFVSVHVFFDGINTPPRRRK